MRAFVLAAIASLAAAHGASGSHSGPPGHPNPYQAFPSHNGYNQTTCISAADAQLVGTDFGLLISNYTETLAVQLLAEGFTDQSDSVNTLIHEPGLKGSDLGPLTFSSKTDFLEGQGSQPAVPFEILNLWSTCDTVIIHWLSNQDPFPVRGVSIAIVQEAKAGEGGGVGTGEQKWQIKTVLAEFNSGAWLGNLGYPECGSSNATANTTATK